jgi:hypothetical protein
MTLPCAPSDTRTIYGCSAWATNALQFRHTTTSWSPATRAIFVSNPSAHQRRKLADLANKNMQVKNCLVNEDKYDLGRKADDLLTAVQSLSDDVENMGNRAPSRATQGIFNQIRCMLDGRWDDEDGYYSKSLQKIATARSASIRRDGGGREGRRRPSLPGQAMSVRERV